MLGLGRGSSSCEIETEGGWNGDLGMLEIEQGGGAERPSM